MIDWMTRWLDGAPADELTEEEVQERRQAQLESDRMNSLTEGLKLLTERVEAIEDTSIVINELKKALAESQKQKATH